MYNILIKQIFFIKNMLILSILILTLYVLMLNISIDKNKDYLFLILSSSLVLSFR